MDRLKKISILAVIALFAASFAFADEVGRFASVEGKVDLLKAGQAEAVQVAADDVVSSGDIVRTKGLSKAEVKFSDNSSLKIGENSRVQIKEYKLENGKRTDGTISLERGNIRATVSRASGKNDFKIETPNAAGSVKGTDLFVAFQKSATSVLVVSGKFSVANLAFPDKAVEVTSGNATLVPPNEPPQAQREYLALEKSNYETSTEPAVQKAVALEKDAAKAAGTSASAEGYSSPGEMKAKVIAVSGSVRIRSRGSLVWHDAKANELLNAGDTIETKNNGKIEIRTDNGNTIDLKPDSQLVLQALTEDQKNGEYQNLFESKYGKLRAKVGKLKGNSKFEVKTPTAVAAVRGTIMYLNILPGLTSTYFEEGNGYVKSLISNISKVVAAGNTSSVDSSGNVTDPHPASDSERSSWQEGWGGEGGAEGYSAPAGDTAGGETEGETETPDTITGGVNNTGPFNDKPFTDLTSTGPDGGTTPEGTPTGETASANLNGIVTGNFDEESPITIALTSDSVLTDATDTLPVGITGSYSNPNSRKLWWGDMTGSDVDAGSFKGWMGGTWHSWEGVVSSIYIDSTGQAGNIFGYLSGATTGDDIAGGLSGNGDLFLIPMANLEPGVAYNIEPGYGSGYISASFDDGNGSFDAGYFREMKRIEGQNWGIWREKYIGNYYNERGSESWTGVDGGDYNDGGYFITSLTGIDDLNGSVGAVLAGMHLDHTTLGVYYGMILGDYDEEEGALQAVGLGAFAENPLTFSGSWGSDSLYSNEEGYISWAGDEYGLTGSIVSDWWNSGSEGFPVVAMGLYDIESPSETGRYIWNSPIQSDDTTIDGGAFFGFTAGIWNNGTMDGKAVALYIDPSNNTGLLTGDVSGSYYSDISMWAATGTLTPISKSYTDIAPEDFVYNIVSDPINNNGLYGNFTDADGNPVEGSYIQGWQVEDGGYSYNIAGDDRWGIFNIKLGDGNSFNNPGYLDQNENLIIPTGWNAVMGGTDSGEGGTSYWITNISGTWQNNEIRGNVSGNILSYEALGTIRGDLFGINRTLDSTWVATAIGTWSEQPLAFSGSYAAQQNNEGAFGYYDNIAEYVSLDSGNIQGLMGGTESLGENPVSVTFMGQYENPYNDKLWAVDISGLDNDGTAFYGTTGGVTLNDSLEGGLIAMYIRPGGETGYIVSTDLSKNFNTLTGNFYPALEMFEASGYLTAFPMGMTEYSPDDLHDGSDAFDNGGDFGGVVSGDIAGNIRGDSLGLKDQDWELWRLGAGGTSTGSLSNNWKAILSGSDEYSSNGAGSWIGTVTGDTWSDNKLSAVVSGISLNYHRDYESAGVFELDVFEGNLVGVYEENTWQALGIGTSEEITTFNDTDITRINTVGNGLGSIGSDLMTGLIVGQAFAATQDSPDRGDVKAVLAGPGNITADSNWRLALGIKSLDEVGAVDGYILMTAMSDPEDGTAGTYRGVYLDPGAEGTFNVGSETGNITNIQNVDTTWTATATGEWVDLAQLSTDALDFTPDALASMVSVPITETYASLLTGSGNFGAGGAINASMDISMYANAATALNGIWAALINGNYSGNTGNNWSVNVSDGTANATLTGTQWDNGQWLANVDGTINNATITGQAGGTYTAPDPNTGTGSLTGVGAGTWQQTQTPQ